MEYNDLSGNVPPEIGDIGTLTSLDVGGNEEMGGALPVELAKLDNMESLFTDGTDLCGPDDRDSRKWQRVPMCSPLAAYLVQSVQSREFPVPLVAGEAALLRVFVNREEEEHRPDSEDHRPFLSGR